MVKRQKKKKSAGVAEMLLLFLALCLELLTSQTLLGLRMRAHSKLPPIQETVSSPHNSNESNPTLRRPPRGSREGVARSSGSPLLLTLVFSCALPSVA